MTFAALDQGSSSTKGALFAADGTVLATSRVPIGARRDGDRVEHDAGEILDSVLAVLAHLREAGPIEALGLACQRSTCLLWDPDTGEPLSRALSWQDRRTASDLAAWSEDDRREVAARTGLRLSPHYAGSKLAWLLDHVPAARGRAERGELVASTLDAFLAGRLTGVTATEPGHAGRTLLYHLEGDRWDPWLLDRFAIPRACLPPLMPSVAGRGSREDVPLRVVLGDQQAALIGPADPVPESAAVHFGTGAFVLAPTGDELVRARDLLSAVLWSDGHGRRFQLEGSVNSAGSAVDWMVARLGFDLDAWTPERFDLAGLPLCVPAFAGLGAPWWDPSAGAAFFGLRETSGAHELVAGVVVGIALRVVDNLRALEEAGQTIRTVRTSGRLARLDALGRLLADASGCRVERLVEEEAGLAGVARLLGVRFALRSDRSWEPDWTSRQRDAVYRAWKRRVDSVSDDASFPESGARRG